MILPCAPVNRRFVAHGCAHPQFGFASAGRGAHDERACESPSQNGGKLIPIPSPIDRSGLRAGSLRGAALWRNSAYKGRSCRYHAEMNLELSEIGVGFAGITTQNGGSSTCVNLSSFLHFSAQRPLLAACRPMASAPLRVPPRAQLSRMCWTPTSLRAQPLARLQAPIATTRASAANLSCAPRLTLRSGRVARFLNTAIGGRPSGGVFYSTDRLEITKSGAGAMAAAPDGKGPTCSRKS